MSKQYKFINIRVSPDLYDKLVDLGISRTECFLRGVETYYDEIELDKLAQKLLSDYTRVYTMLEKKREKKKIKVNKVDEELKAAFNPEFYIGKEIDGIKVTKDMVDKVKKEKLLKQQEGVE